MSQVGTSDKNFYDRCYFNAHDRTGDVFVITGLGSYANLGVRSTRTSPVKVGDTVRTARFSATRIDPDRMHQQVGAVPHRGARAAAAAPGGAATATTTGVGLDLTWEGSFDAVRGGAARHQRRAPRTILQTHSASPSSAPGRARCGSTATTIAVEPSTVGRQPATGRGASARWATPTPQGDGRDTDFDGFWWLYVPLRFEEFAIMRDACRRSPTATAPSTTPSGCGPTAGSSSSAGRRRGPVRLGHPHAHATRPSTAPRRTGRRCTSRCESLLAVPLHVGGGYGGDPDWLHGMWKGEGFVERRDYDMASSEVQGRFMFGVVDHVGRVICEEGGRTSEGWGLFEHGALGRHDPSGFEDWFTLAP